MSFAPKRDKSVVLLLFLGWAIFVSIFVLLMFQNQQPAFVFIISTLLIIYVALAIFRVVRLRYELHDEFLYARSGHYNTVIDYNDIRTVDTYEQMYPLGFSLAMAKRGLVIHYDKGIYRSVKIAPADETEFLATLHQKNANIKIDANR
ncbi:PH domain-containing protein [Geomicrobium sp. JCM 19037]|uniref:PH domain-containing protein n=1 Tax=Geomicrobium sp. JCM 19037 TaxID=1460634 RepID=UPI0005AABAE2|nr:PH domain-containing protein [Geomicrobium sp. JCM 19037]